MWKNRTILCIVYCTWNFFFVIISRGKVLISLCFFILNWGAKSTEFYLASFAPSFGTGTCFNRALDLVYSYNEYSVYFFKFANIHLTRGYIMDRTSGCAGWWILRVIFKRKEITFVSSDYRTNSWLWNFSRLWLCNTVHLSVSYRGISHKCCSNKSSKYVSLDIFLGPSDL